MNQINISQYLMDEAKEKRLWEECIFVFDSSALLEFYFLPITKRNNIYSEVFSKLDKRLWIPHHVEFEYLKNRKKIISKPIKEKYSPIKEKIKTLKNSFNKEISTKLNSLSNETKKDDKHPFLDQTEILSFKEAVDSFEKRIIEFEKNILNQITDSEEEIRKSETNDDVLDSLEKYFLVGREYQFNEIITLIQEGKLRYEFKIPPGYGDYYNKEKKGTQIFGDLIIWKQILEYSKEVKLPIIFITNDIKKDEDWCYLEEKVTEDRILAPREELIKEIKDHSGVDFWMYNLPQFLYFANIHLQSQIEESTIQNLYQALNEKGKKGNLLRFNCNNCSEIHSYEKNEIDLDFDFISSEERNMGAENHYSTTLDFNCHCGNQIEVVFELWEYPIGIHNYDKITINGGELLDPIYFTINFSDDYDGDVTRCLACTGNKDGYENTINEWQEVEINNQINTENELSKINNIKIGKCNWCDATHYDCPNCNTFSYVKDDQDNYCQSKCGYKIKSSIKKLSNDSIKSIYTFYQ